MVLPPGCTMCVGSGVMCSVIARVLYGAEEDVMT